MFKKKIYLIILLFGFGFSVQSSADSQKNKKLEAVPFFVVSQHSLFVVDDLGHPFEVEKNCIVRVALEIQGLKSIKIPLIEKAIKVPVERQQKLEFGFRTLEHFKGYIIDIYHNFVTLILE